MSKTLIRNPSNNPLALPFPFRGALPAGGGAVVDATVAQVRAALGAGVYDLSEVDHMPADAFYLGNLLDPVPWRASLLIDGTGEAAFVPFSHPGGEIIHSAQGTWELTPPPAAIIFLDSIHLVDGTEPHNDIHVNSIVGGVLEIHCVATGSSNAVDPPAGSKIFITLGLKA